MATNVFHLLLCIFLLTLAFPCHSRPSKPKAQNPKFFDFVKNLEGCKKGQTVIGLHQLRTYLSKHGYLNYSADQTHAEDNNFDDALEATIKTYQINFHLKPTGTLDAQTVSQMMKPRYWLPDIINGTDRMQAHKQMANHTQNTLHNDSHFAFFRYGPAGSLVARWPIDKWDLTYGFRRGFPAQFMPPFRRAFLTWAAASVFEFTETTSYYRADLKIMYVRGAHGCSDPFNDVDIAHSSPPTLGEMHVNAAQVFSIDPSPSAYHMETVALHEIGHMIGLDHSDDREAVMFKAIRRGEVRGLDPDDTVGIETLYNF